MPDQKVSRRRLLAATAIGVAASTLSASGLVWAAPVGDAQAERFIADNMGRLVALLDNPALTSVERARAFADLIGAFVDLRRISTFVLGRYAAQLRSDPALLSEWTRTFNAFATANYQARLDRFRGRSLRLTGSMIRIADRDVVVNSQLHGGSSRDPTLLRWRVMRDETGWKVVDMSVVLSGDEIWLAQQQRIDFVTWLDQNGGDLRALFARVRQNTSLIENRAAS